MESRIRRRSLLLGAGAAGAAIVAGVRPAAARPASTHLLDGGVSREPFTIGYLPDTQIAVQSYPEFYYAQTNWLATNRNALNIRFVVHVGDIVEMPRTADYGRARTGMNTLDGKIPYVIAIGNHDMDAWVDGWEGIERNRTCNTFNSYFPRSKFAAWPSFGASYPSNLNDNSFHRFTAGGTDWAILTLKFNPTDAELAWGASVIAANPQRQFIINTHDCMNGTTRSTVGNRIWNAVGRPYPNVVLILNGHYTNQGSRVDPGDNGNPVFQVMCDYQDYDAADRYENSFLRTMRFDPVAGTIAIRSYSPYLNQYRTDARNQFTLTGVPFPPGAPKVRRHITDRTSLDAWHFTLADHWLLPDDQLAAYPEGRPLPAAPQLTQATGQPEVYLLDNGTKRHVPSQQVMTAWRWTYGEVVKRTPAEIAAIPTGRPVVEYPYQVKGTGAAIYLLDDPAA